MLIHHAIFLLLSWPCARAIQTEKPPPEDIFDQIATASENLGLSFENPDSSSKSTPNPTTTSVSKASTIHYENSNGFIPITSIDAISSMSPEHLDNNSSVEDQSSYDPAPSSGLIEDDPAYSTEARMFLNLAGPGADRRSFDAQDHQNEFEILKVTNETPAIANYHDFYENMQNKLHRGRGVTDGRYDQSEVSTGGRTVAQNQRTKERIKKIEKYLTKYQGDHDLRTSDSYKNYYSFGSGNAQSTIGQSKAIFEPEKVQNNANQHSAIYDVYGESPNNRQRTSSSLRSNYDSVAARHTPKSHASTIAKNRHVNSKPVVVVEPSDYKLDMKYGTDQSVVRVSSTDHYRTEKLRNEPEVEARNLYDVESRVNRQDRYTSGYDRNEDSVDYSDESNDYVEVTEKPKRTHKNKRRPHSSDSSRRLPKEHRGHQSNDEDDDNDDVDSGDSRKHNSSTRSKLHRPKAKPSYWNEDDSSPMSEESSEERQRNVKSNHSAKTEDSHSKKHASKGKVTNWSQIGPNLEVSHSNGFEIDQNAKPKLLVPVNLNLVPLSSFDHSTALGNSQGFDFTNVPNFVTATPMVSSAAPLLSTSQSVISPHVAHPPNAVKSMPNLANNNYGLSTAVPDIIVGQNTYHNPVQALLLPQMNVNNKYSNTRPHYLPSTASPIFSVSTQGNHNVHSHNPTAQNVAHQNYHSTVSPRPAASQNVHHVTINPGAPTSQPQFVVSQPLFAHNQAANQNTHSPNPTPPSIAIQNYQSTVTPRSTNMASHNHHQHFTVNPATPTAQPQFALPQPTHQSFALQDPFNGHSSYNIFVNPNGLHGQNLIQHGHPNGHGPPIHNGPTSATTPQPDLISNNNMRGSEQQVQKNTAHNSDGQFLTSASFAVGHGEQQQKNNANDNKYLTTSSQHNVHQNNNNLHQNNNLNNLNQNNNNNNNNNNPYQNNNSNNLNQNNNNLPHQNNNNNLNQNNNGRLNQNYNSNNYFNEHHNSQHTLRPSQQQNFYHFYRDDESSSAKLYEQPIHEAASMIQQSHNAIPLNFDNQNYANTVGQFNDQHSAMSPSAMSPSVVGPRVRDQNQQILKAANDIFENTWKQLQQLRANEDVARNMPYQHIYRVNDNVASTSNFNVNTANALQGNQVKAHLPNLGTQNVEILNPNLKQSPIGVTMINPYASLNPYQAVLTTPIPIFTTAASFLTPRPLLMSPTPETINLQNYVNSLTQFSSHNNQANKFENKPDNANQENQRPLYNPINFVPNLDLMKSQSMLNSKLVEPLPNQLNLVPVIPGGNFFKNTHDAQNDLVQKPRLRSDLEKYADEMFKESLKTIYATHKWNNDRRTRNNFTASELNDLAKLKGELQRFKASMPDPNYSGKDVLEAHHSETKVRTAEPSKTTKKPDLSIAAIEQLFKAAVKNNLSDSAQNFRPKNRQNHGHTSRPAPAKDHSNDFRNKHQLNDYLTPPKPNSFLSKSPFNDAPKPIKKRPGSSSGRRPSARPGTSASRTASNPEASASNQYQHRHSHRHSDHSDYRTDSSYDNYPTFTTASSPDDDPFKSSGEQLSKSEFFDINHPRTHNLLGLLMKNNKLPTGTAQSFFRDDDELKQYFENEKRRTHLQFYDENRNDFQKKVDGHPVNMEPPAPPKIQEIRYYTGRRAA